MFEIGGTVFLIVFIIVIGAALVKNGFSGNGGGCGLLAAAAIVIGVVWFLVKSCQSYEEDWGPHGRFAPRKYKIKYDEKGRPYINNRYDAPDSDFIWLDDEEN